MVWRFLFIVPLATVGMTLPSQAGIFTRKPKVDPAEHVAELVHTLRTDKDERHRVSAADELGSLDAKTYPIVQSALIEALMHDSSSSVRHESAQALGRVRPLSAQAAFALQQAVTSDNSTRVRLTARTALWEYHLAGFRGSGTPPTGPQTLEPPMATGQAQTGIPAPPRANTRPSVEPTTTSNITSQRTRMDAPLAIPQPLPKAQHSEPVIVPQAAPGAAPQAAPTTAPQATPSIAPQAAPATTQTTSPFAPQSTLPIAPPVAPAIAPRTAPITSPFSPRTTPPAALKLDPPEEARIKVTPVPHPAQTEETKIEALKPAPTPSATKPAAKKDDDGPLLNPPG
jgi:hypothetical protein